MDVSGDWDSHQSGWRIIDFTGRCPHKCRLYYIVLICSYSVRMFAIEPVFRIQMSIVYLLFDHGSAYKWLYCVDMFLQCTYVCNRASLFLRITFIYIFAYLTMVQLTNEYSVFVCETHVWYNHFVWVLNQWSTISKAYGMSYHDRLLVVNTLT